MAHHSDFATIAADPGSHALHSVTGPVRILMLATDLQRGGLPLRLARLARRLRDAGVEPLVGCLTPPGPLSHELAEQGLTTFSCDAAGSFDASCLARLAGHIRRLNPDLIHASLFHANLAARLVGRLDRQRPIVTSTVTIEIERPMHRVLEALTAGRSDIHVANSTAVAAHLVNDFGMDESRLVVIPNAIDFAEIDAASKAARSSIGLKEGVPLVAWAGRMDPVKNLPTFVSVIGQLRKQMDVQAVLLGDGPIREAIVKEVARRNLTEAVRFAGWSQSVASWLKVSDALLFPSLTEGSPNTVLEAMACGCAVVASDIPSCRELIRDGVEGQLCAPLDVDGFARALMQVLQDRSKYREMAGRSHERLRQRHDLESIVGEWSALYRRVLAVT